MLPVFCILYSVFCILYSVHYTTHNTLSIHHVPARPPISLPDTPLNVRVKPGRPALQQAGQQGQGQGQALPAQGPHRGQRVPVPHPAARGRQLWAISKYN